jgi:hypothetical protein
MAKKKKKAAEGTRKAYLEAKREDYQKRIKAIDAELRSSK